MWHGFCSVEAYLEDVLYLDFYKFEVWPKLSATFKDWEENRLSAPDVMQSLNEMIIKNSIPALWLMP